MKYFSKKIYHEAGRWPADSCVFGDYSCLHMRQSSFTELYKLVRHTPILASEMHEYKALMR